MPSDTKSICSLFASYFKSVYTSCDLDSIPMLGLDKVIN